MTDEPIPLAETMRRVQAKVRPVDDADVERARLEQQAATIWEQRIPRRFRDATLADVDEPAASVLWEWAANATRSNLVLLGPVGSGKTHAAVGALRVCHERGASVMFAPIVEALDWLRPGGPPDTAQRLGAVRVLILDDVGAERPTDWTAERLYGIVNRRWLNELPTVVTTNLDPVALEGTLDPRLFSRLVHQATAVNFGGRDRRRR